MEQRVLVYTPTGKDGRLIAGVLRRAQIDSFVACSPRELEPELGKGAGCILVADEALNAEFRRVMAQYLARQPAWSDLPILVLSKRGMDAPEMRPVYLELGNVTLLERPVQSLTLLSAVASALRARSRQYEMREVDRRKDEFLAMLAHELRNPLAPIGAAADLLRYVDLDRTRIQQTSEIIARQVAHMTGLIDDLLDVSRVSRGLVALEHVPVDVRQTVSNAVEQVRPLIDARGHRLTVQTPPESAYVHGDPKRLTQVVSNLLNNAAKYSQDGGNINLTLEVGPEAVTVDLTDDGIGMTADTVGHVFEMFTQADRTSDRSQGGLGIGLALVKSLVELHGGSVGAYSAGIGKGSRFTVSLPRTVCPDPTGESSTLARATPTSSRRRLLLVDDNVDAARLLAMLLESAGHEVLVEHNAQDALRSAHAHSPDFFLLDIGLPGMDGNELARRLRAQHGGSPLMIAITGYGQEADREKSQEAGFDHHFVKPVNTEQLFQLLASWP